MKRRSVELLSHFQCDLCERWWSIGDAPENKRDWHCPWCGMPQVEKEEPKNEGEIPDWNATDDLKKTLEQAAKEMEKLFGPLKEMFGKK